jgi:hypothetical protein
MTDGNKVTIYETVDWLFVIDNSEELAASVFREVTLYHIPKNCNLKNYITVHI